MKETIGIVGLGRMGLPAAKILMRAGLHVIGYEKRREAIQEGKRGYFMLCGYMETFHQRYIPCSTSLLFPSVNHPPGLLQIEK